MTLHGALPYEQSGREYLAEQAEARRLSYRRVHARRVGKYGSAKAYLCEGGCGGRAAAWATVHPVEEHSQTDVLWIDIVPLCRSCHTLYDQTPEGRARAAEKNRGQVRTPEQRQRIADGRRAVKARLPEPTEEFHAARVRAGRKSGVARGALTDQQREQIRALYAGGGVTQRQLAGRFGVTQAAIWKVINP